jgi:hypothetical protein
MVFVVDSFQREWKKISIVRNVQNISQNITFKKNRINYIDRDVDVVMG